MTAKKLLRKTGRVLLYILCFVLLVIVAAFIFVNTEYGKKTVRNKVEAYLEKKLNTKVTIASINYSLPKWIELKGFYIEDQHKDTLLYGEKLAVDLDMIKLLRGSTYIRKVEITNSLVNISRSANDSIFNFQFIVDAFSGNKPDSVVDKDTASFNLVLKKLILGNVGLRYNDRYTGTNFTTRIKKMEADLSTFRPDRLQFDIDKFYAAGIDFFMVMDKIDTSGSTNPVAPTSNSLQLLAAQMTLDTINVSIDDRVSGMYYGNKVQHLSLNKGFLSLYQQTLTADTLVLDSSSIKYIAPKLVARQAGDTTVLPSWKIGLNKLLLHHDYFQMDDNNIAAKQGFDPAHLEMQHINADAAKLFYSPDSMVANISQLSFKDKGGFILDTTHAILSYTSRGITAKELYVKTPKSLIQHSFEVTYKDISQLANDPENSTVDIKLQNTVVSINDLYAVLPFVKQFMPPEKFNGNTVKLNTEVSGTLQRMYIPFLQLTGFSGSSINARAIIYNVTNKDKLSYDITILNSNFLKVDLAKFLPPANQQMLDKMPPVVNLTAHFTGSLKNTNADFNIKGSTFSLAGRAAFKNLDDPKKLQYDFAISQGNINKDFLASIIPPASMPPNIHFPDKISFSGKLKADANNIEPDLKLKTSYGDATIKGYLRNFNNKEAATYDLQVSTTSFDLGKLIGQDTLLGNITLSGSAKGRGFNYKTMNAVINTDINSAFINGHNYRNASITADLNRGKIISNGNINDSSLRLKYNIAANLSRQYPSDVNATFIVDTIQFRELHLYKDALDASFKATVKAADLDPQNLDLYAVIDSSKLRVRGKQYFLDSIIAKGTTANGIHDISFRSPFADLTAKGNFDYDKIGQSILQYTDKYYNISNQAAQAIRPQQITFEGVAKKHPLITDLVQGLAYENVAFKGSYASQGGDSSLKFDATLPYLAYQNYIVHNGKASVTTLNDQVNYAVTFDTLNYFRNTLYASNIKGYVAHDSLNIDALTKDAANTDIYAIGAAIAIRGDAYIFSLKENLLLNYKKWSVAPNNSITYSAQGVLVNNFSLTSNDAKIIANSQQNVLNSPVDISIQNFDIRDITSFVNNDTLLVSGLINGKVTVSDFNKTLPGFTGDLSVSNVLVMNQPVGTIRFTAQKQDDNTINATLKLSENGNDASMSGHYYLNNTKQQFDADISIARLNIATLQSFSAGSLTRSAGNINGNISVNGKFSDPRWKGLLNFDSVQFATTKLGALYHINQQKIVLDYPTVKFSNFIVTDSTNHSLILDGNIYSASLTEYDLALKARANDFIILNASRAANDQLFGFAAIDADISIVGTSLAPTIEGSLSMNERSDVTIVLPETNINKDAAASVVRFIDKDTFALPEMKTFQPAKATSVEFGRFLNYNLNISVAKDATLTVVIDPVTGDELRVQGEAQLNAGVDPGGHLLLAGNYELNNGYYIFNYQFLQRRFNLVKGSNIIFGGDPKTAQIDITAEYIVNTPASDLLQNEVGSLDAASAAGFGQKIPFRVMLYLSGTLQKPTIKFNIVLPDQNTLAISGDIQTAIDNKLLQLQDDEASMNKQVFSLLVLGRFTGEQSTDFFKGNGVNFNDLARQSVSGFLSSALNEIAADLFKGVDIDLNLNSYQDYNSSQRTDLNVAVSKSFANNRLTITVGKNFGIEGQSPTDNANSNTFLPDLTINYKLTTDGRYMIRAYSKNQYEVLLDGFVVETGVAFIVTMDYEKFRELFIRKKKKKAVTQ